MDLAATSHLLRLLADPTRMRLIALLEREELTVAEIAEVLSLAQPRVSTHLARLREAGLVHDRRAGVSAYYRARLGQDSGRDAVLKVLKDGVDDALLQDDAKRLPAVLAQRDRQSGWADSVAGDMERHYSPGRTWETLARSLLQLLASGDVLDVASGDGVLAELLAPHAHSIRCVDQGVQVVAAARKRLQGHPNVQVCEGDMHALEFDDASFDLVLMMHALTYSEQPQLALQEAVRVLRPGGRLLAATLAQHSHHSTVAPFDHVNLGFLQTELEAMGSRAGLEIVQCTRVSRERRPPHFEVITLLARKP